MSGGIIYLAAAILALLIVLAAISDLRSRTIANRLNAAIALTAPLWWWATGLSVWPDIAIQIVLALGAFALLAIAFRFGMMGGGDVKMIAAIALWLPPLPFVRMLVVMALAGGVLTLATIAWHRARRAGGQPEIPYGVAIAFATAWVVTNDILTIPVP
jgi:prepilin peptidase CpaA